MKKTPQSRSETETREWCSVLSETQWENASIFTPLVLTTVVAWIHLVRTKYSVWSSCEYEERDFLKEERSDCSRMMNRDHGQQCPLSLYLSQPTIHPTWHLYCHHAQCWLLTRPELSICRFESHVSMLGASLWSVSIGIAAQVIDYNSSISSIDHSDGAQRKQVPLTEFTRIPCTPRVGCPISPAPKAQGQTSLNFRVRRWVLGWWQKSPVPP